MEFLILKPSSLGDILHAFPAVSALLRAYPGSVADWLIHPAFADLTAFLPGVRSNLFFERKKLGSLRQFPKTFLRLWKDIRNSRYDAVIDLQGLARSAFIGRCAAGLHAGPAHPRETAALCCYSRRLHCPDSIHAVERNNAMIADFLHRSDLDFSYTMPHVPRFAEAAEALLRDAGADDGAPLAAIAPGARWATKQWPPEFFASVMNQIAKAHPDMRFLLLGGQNDSPAARTIQSLAEKGVSAVDLCGKTSVGSLVEVIRRTSLFLCNDSGPMHIAAALGIPVLALFGPTSPVLTGPYSKKSHILQPSLPCISCFKRYCSNSLCHVSVNPESAAEAAEDLLTNGVVPT